MLFQWTVLYAFAPRSGPVPFFVWLRYSVLSARKPCRKATSGTGFFGARAGSVTVTSSGVPSKLFTIPLQIR